MLNDNIRKYRKSKQMSQDELAERLQVTRQSISLWETGQTQPSLDNIVELAKLFNIPVDALLTDSETESVDTAVMSLPNDKSKRKIFIITICIVVISILISGIALWKSDVFSSNDNNVVNPENVIVSEVEDSTELDEPEENNIVQSTINETNSTENETNNTNNNQSAVSENYQGKLPQQEGIIKPTENETISNDDNKQSTVSEKEQDDLPKQEEKTQPVVNETNSDHDKNQITTPENTESVVETPENNTEKDLYTYLKDFVLQNGKVNGDYCYYSKPADNYGGYSSEDFSLYYWADTEKIEFCLHSVLDDEFSINFYIYVPKQHTGNYDYISSYYYRDTGEPLYEARGIINGNEFSKNSPINCSDYFGSTQVQNDFMEMSRQGICDLIDCLKNFITVEGLKYSFFDFGFTNF